MPLPTKSRYTIAEAAKFIKSATGETVTPAQIFDWATQGLYRLHLAIEHCSIRAIGETEIISVRDSMAEVRLSSGQAAILGRGERVGITACWHNGIACNFVRRSTYGPVWRPDTVNFGAAGLVLLGAELAAFTASIAEPQQTAPEQDAAKPAPVETVGQRRARYLAWFTEEERINPRGALQRVTEREALQNPKADRSNIGKDIKQAQGAAKTQKQAGAMFGQLVRDGKRQN